MYWDVTYVLVIIGALISAWASFNVNRTYKKYERASNSRGMTGSDCAGRILHRAGINDVRIEHIQGSLTDHYSPNEKVLRLSDSVYSSASVAALGVAAHECGHAIQHQEGYGPIKLRSLSVPVANIGSKLSWPIVLLGLLMGLPELARVGVILFGLVVLFQLITLPVELNASRRALKVLQEDGILYGDELTGAKKVLTAAALTYVAALFAAILQLLRLLILTENGRSNRRR